MSDVSTSLPQFLPTAATQESAQRFTLPARPLKIAAATAIALVGAYGVTMDQQYVSTSNAVITAYVLDVRTPIEGTLQDVPATAGEMVPAGALLGRIENDLTDHQHLDNLRITEEEAHGKAVALAQERVTLEGIQRELLARAAIHTTVMRQRVGRQTEAANMVLSSKAAALAEADTELDRGRKLVSLGVISRAAFDKLAATQLVLANEVRSQEALYGSALAEQQALQQGILAEPGTNNDVSYSLQRADELSVKLAENARDLQAATAQARNAQTALQSEALRSSRLDQSEVRAPSAGMVWRLHAVNGEHLAADAPVLSLVDCRRQFLVAEVPQDRASTLLRNSKVDIKLAGEAGTRSGTLMTVSGRQETELDSKLAAMPNRKPTEDMAKVVVLLDTAATADKAGTPCLVGRTARVRLPTQSTNLLTLWFSQRL